MTERAANRSTAVQRVGAALGGLACLAVLVIGASIPPSPAGHGTHEALGVPACGWAQVFDFPCATCGMTTAVAHASHGSIVQAAVVQPAGALFALGCGVVFWLCAHTALTGSRASRLCGLALTARGLILLGIAVGVSWAYKAFTWA